MRHMLSSALIAGFAAGLLCALLQYLLIEPKIALAERYETHELVYFQGAPSAAAQAAAIQSSMPGMDMSSAEPGAGEPAGLTRHALTVLFAIVTYCGYGLVLMGAIRLAETSGIVVDAKTGLLWGLAGFLAFQMMPALGLQPDVPGVPAADLDARQLWWSATAAATGIGLWFMAYGTGLWQRALGVVVLFAPHLWGAPQLAEFAGIVPPELASSFAARTLAVGLITWLALGGLVAVFWHSEAAP